MTNVAAETALLFPTGGYHWPGMGADVKATARREIFDRAESEVVACGGTRSARDDKHLGGWIVRLDTLPCILSSSRLHRTSVNFFVATRSGVVRRATYVPAAA